MVKFRLKQTRSHVLEAEITVLTQEIEVLKDCFPDVDLNSLETELKELQKSCRPRSGHLKSVST